MAEKASGVGEAIDYALHQFSIVGAAADDFARTKAIYDSAKAGRQLMIK